MVIRTYRHSLAEKLHLGIHDKEVQQVSLPLRIAAVRKLDAIHQAQTLNDKATYLAFTRFE